MCCLETERITGLLIPFLVYAYKKEKYYSEYGGTKGETWHDSASDVGLKNFWKSLGGSVFSSGLMHKGKKKPKGSLD